MDTNLFELITKSRIKGLLLFPLFYARWSFVYIWPIMFFILRDYTAKTDQLSCIGVCVIVNIMYIGLYTTIFANFEVMIPATKWLLKTLKINYKEVGRIGSDVVNPGINGCGWSIYETRTVVINEKEYKFTVTTSGGVLYNPDANIRRRIFYTWIFCK